MPFLHPDTVAADPHAGHHCTHGEPRINALGIIDYPSTAQRHREALHLPAFLLPPPPCFSSFFFPAILLLPCPSSHLSQIQRSECQEGDECGGQTCGISRPTLACTGCVQGTRPSSLQSKRRGRGDSSPEASIRCPQERRGSASFWFICEAIHLKKCQEVGRHIGASSVDSGLGRVAGRWSVLTVILDLWLKWMMSMLS
ncbi:hypothetical protein ZWY2020_027389 [Hordeum vulgare]|nr:hypothetical protein ZWY2020_027389 [Hordeum vulgare]